jgi:hypothetical protein
MKPSIALVTLKEEIHSPSDRVGFVRNPDAIVFRCAVLSDMRSSPPSERTASPGRPVFRSPPLTICGSSERFLVSPYQFPALPVTLSDYWHISCHTRQWGSFACKLFVYKMLRMVCQ